MYTIAQMLLRTLSHPTLKEKLLYVRTDYLNLTLLKSHN